MTTTGTEFTLDTSGFVEGPPAGIRTKRIYWSDIGALPYGLLAQGYIEALFASLPRAWGTERPYMRNGRDFCGHFVGFRHLHPSTLAAILKDCSAAAKDAAGAALTEEDGGEFWADRQAGKWPGRFPPQTPSLDDEGKVLLS